MVADAWVQSRIGAGCGPPDIRAPAAELGAALVSEVVAGMHAVPRALALLCDGVAVSPALCTRAERDGLVRAILDLACDDQRPPVMRIGALRTARVLTVDTPMDAARPEVPRANASELVTRLWSLAAAPAVARMLSCVAFNDTTPRGCAVVGGIAAEAAAFLQALLAGSACYGDAARDKLRRGPHELPLAAVRGTEVGAGHVRAGARIAVYVARSRTYATRASSFGDAVVTLTLLGGGFSFAVPCVRVDTASGSEGGIIVYAPRVEVDKYRILRDSAALDAPTEMEVAALVPSALPVPHPGLIAALQPLRSLIARGLCSVLAAAAPRSLSKMIAALRAELCARAALAARRYLHSIIAGEPAVAQDLLRALLATSASTERQQKQALVGLPAMTVAAGVVEVDTMERLLMSKDAVRRSAPADAHREARQGAAAREPARAGGERADSSAGRRRGDTPLVTPDVFRTAVVHIAGSGTMCAMAGDTHAKTTTIVAAVKEASHGVTRSGYAYAVDMLLQLASVAAFDAICLSSAATGAAWMSALLSAARGGMRDARARGVRACACTQRRSRSNVNAADVRYTLQWQRRGRALGCTGRCSGRHRGRIRG